jgi:putative membrane protein
MEGVKDRILVISIDRDNDLGIKAGVPGPVMGRDAVIEAAAKLGVKDPGDTDMNAMFEAVRVYDDVRKTHDAEVAILTGDRDVGVKSDREVRDQLEKALRHFKATAAVIVSDGSEDDHVTPIIQAQVPILSMKRVVVKQSEKLESTYYKIKDFIKESVEDPKMAKLFFGIPAVALILIAVFGMEGWRIVLGMLGAYLVLKAFKMEGYFGLAGKEVKDSFTSRRLSFFMYVLGALAAALAVYRGYTAMQDWLVLGMFESAAAFVAASVYNFWLAGTLLWLGVVLESGRHTRRRAAAMPLFGLSVALVIDTGAELIIRQDAPVMLFMAAIVAGFALLFLALYMDRKTDKKEKK